MKTKEEILDKYYQPKMHWKLVNRANVLKAMEEYLERNAASFISSNPLVIKSVCDCKPMEYDIDGIRYFKCRACGEPMK